MAAAVTLALPVALGTPASAGSAPAAPEQPTAAAIPVTVTPGGPFTATGGPFVIRFDSGHSITCQGWRMGGDFTAEFLMLPPVSLSGCTPSWVFTPLTVTVPQWPFDWVFYSQSIDAAFGQTPDVAIRVTSAQCSFTINGLNEFSYENATGRLGVGGQIGPGGLVANNVSGCFGAVRPGDRAKLGRGYLQVSPFQVVRPATG
ncbi:MAG TPA: hypothetical protein VGD67_10295 [Pseudonocardiaceae bacterium]